MSKDEGLGEKVNSFFNTITPKGLDNKLLKTGDKIATSAYNKYGISNNQLSKYMHLGGALGAVTSGGAILPTNELFGGAMLFYTAYHTVMARLASKRQEIDKTQKLVSKRKDGKIMIDEEKVAQYASQNIERKQGKFRRVGMLGISIGFATFGTICAVSGVGLPLTLGLYAFSGSAMLDSFGQYMKVAEIDIDITKVED